MSDLNETMRTLLGFEAAHMQLLNATVELFEQKRYKPELVTEDEQIANWKYVIRLVIAAGVSDEDFKTELALSRVTVDRWLRGNDAPDARDQNRMIHTFTRCIREKHDPLLAC